MYKISCGVEFVGGPLDGFVRKIDVAQRRGDYVVAPINVQILNSAAPHQRRPNQLSDDKSLSGDEPVSSVAVYHLRTWKCGYIYQFVKSVSPLACQID